MEQVDERARYRIAPSTWVPDADAPGPKRTRQPVQIRAYVPAPIAEIDVALTMATVTAVSDAERAIAATQTHAQAIGVGSLAAQLLRSEAIASSQMEGVSVPSNRTIAKVAVSGRHHETAENAREAIRAVREAYDWASSTDEPFDREIVLRVHAAVARGDRHLAAHAGALRMRQNWIGRDPHTPAGADFVPPPADLVPELVDDLCVFLNRSDVSPVVQAAIAHAQFETIHPFPDGNGRVGRTLLGMALCRRGLAERVVPPVSLVLSRDREAYVDGLTRWRFAEDGVTTWIATLADALEETARASQRLADQIVGLQEEWRTRAGVTRRGTTVDRIIDSLLAHPVINGQSGVAQTGRTPQAVLRAIGVLETSGVLAPVTLGKRNRAWECVGLFALLDDFERRLSGGTVGVANTR